MCCITHQKCSTHESWRVWIKVKYRDVPISQHGKYEDRRNTNKFNGKAGNQEIVAEQTGVWAQGNDAEFCRALPSWNQHQSLKQWMSCHIACAQLVAPWSTTVATSYAQSNAEPRYPRRLEKGGIFVGQVWIVARWMGRCCLCRVYV